MSALTSTPTLQMQLNSWRGYSAYEIAVQNGFEGTQSEWLASLKGEPGKSAGDITVNHKTPVSGNITLRGSDIAFRAGAAVTVADKIDEMLPAANVENTLTSSDASRVLSAAQGKELKALVDEKAKTYSVQVTLSVSGWAQEDGEEEYTQTVSVNGLTADSDETSAIAACAPDRAMRESYHACDVIAKAQGNGTLTFSAADVPEIALDVNVLVVVQEV